MKLLTKSSIRYLLRHPALLALSILGVAVGVAVVVSIDLANSSAERAFRLSSESVTGRATHRITGPSGSVPDSVYVDLRVAHGLRDIAPVVEGGVVVQGYEGRSLGLLGIDPFADAPFRGYTGSQAGFDPGAFIGNEPTMLLPISVAAEIDAVEIAGHRVKTGGEDDDVEFDDDVDDEYDDDDEDETGVAADVFDHGESAARWRGAATRPRCSTRRRPICIMRCSTGGIFRS